MGLQHVQIPSQVRTNPLTMTYMGSLRKLVVASYKFLLLPNTELQTD
jgi:hypothetical protein